MKYTIQWLEQKTSAKDVPYTKLTLKKEDGSNIDATIFNSFPNYANIQNGGEIEGELKSNEYNGKTTYTLEAQKSSPRSNFGALKATQIAEAQERKERSIEKAQDRTALTWAKYGACEIVAHHPAYKFLDKEMIPDIIEDLSTKIYNGELIAPFK